MDFWICCGGGTASGGSTVGWIGAGVVWCGMSGQIFFPVLGWLQIIYPQQVVVECAGSGVGAQLSDCGLRELCHPGDYFLGLQNHEGKRKKCGKFFLLRLPGHMSCGSGSALGSTQYTKHQHHAEPKF